MTGLLVSFEGIDFCGKSIQSRLLFNKTEEFLDQNGRNKVHLIREPGGTLISESVRKILLDHSLNMMDSITELLLYEAARSQLIAEVILPALNRNDVVICDRFFDSTTAYQGYGRGISPDTIQSAHKIAVHNVCPDVTFVLDLDPTIARNRQKDAGHSRDRLELESVEFHEKVRNGFIEIAKSEKDRVKIINGNKKIKEISEQVWSVVKGHLVRYINN